MLISHNNDQSFFCTESRIMLDECNQRINIQPGETKTITSPGFPNNYFSFISCRWTFVVSNIELGAFLLIEMVKRTFISYRVWLKGHFLQSINKNLFKLKIFLTLGHH